MSRLLPILNTHASLHLHALKIEGLELGALFEKAPAPLAWRCESMEANHGFDLMGAYPSAQMTRRFMAELLLDE